MGLMDKAKFWKKKEDDFSDFSDLGSFGLDTKSESPPGDFNSDFSELPNIDDPLKSDFPAMDHREEVQPSQNSKNMSDQFGIKQAPAQQFSQPGFSQSQNNPNSTQNTAYPGFQQQQQSAPAQINQYSQYPQQQSFQPINQTVSQHGSQMQSPQPIPQQQYTPQYHPQFSGPDINDIAKEIEIMHAKLDAIKSTLDSVNQRLATLERIASGEPKNRYSW